MKYSLLALSRQTKARSRKPNVRFFLYLREGKASRVACGKATQRAVFGFEPIEAERTGNRCRRRRHTRHADNGACQKDEMAKAFDLHEFTRHQEWRAAYTVRIFRSNRSGAKPTAIGVAEGRSGYLPPARQSDFGQSHGQPEKSRKIKTRECHTESHDSDRL